MEFDKLFMTCNSRNDTQSILKEHICINAI